MSSHNRFEPEEVGAAQEGVVLVGVDRGGRAWPLEESLQEL